MIIAVDYDGTLKTNEGMNVDLIRRLQTHQRRGDVVILWTCRDGKTLIEALQQLQAEGFRPNYVNDNCPAAVRMLGRNPRKIYADVYIDDKAVICR